MDETFDMDLFRALVPGLLQDEAFRHAVEEDLDEGRLGILSRLAGSEEVSDDEFDEIIDDLMVAYDHHARQVLSLGWEGNAPGMSGAIWIYGLKDVYILGSSDYPRAGPFESVDEALDCECFFIATTENPELYSDVLPESRLLEIARGIVDMEEDGSPVWINGDEYLVEGREFVRNRSTVGGRGDRG